MAQYFWVLGYICDEKGQPRKAPGIDAMTLGTPPKKPKRVPDNPNALPALTSLDCKNLSPLQLVMTSTAPRDSEESARHDVQSGQPFYDLYEAADDAVLFKMDN